MKLDTKKMRKGTEKQKHEESRRVWTIFKTTGAKIVEERGTEWKKNSTIATKVE